MSEAKKKFNNSLGMAVVWMIVFGIMLWSFVDNRTILGGIVMIYSVSKAIAYVYQSGFYDASEKALSFVNAAATYHMKKKGRASDDATGQSTD